MSVLHVVNGDANYSRIRGRGAEEIVVWREALADGPVVKGPPERLFTVRRDFVERAYSASPSQYGNMVEVEFGRLTQPNWEHVVLHFDEDLFCVVNAFFCISHLQHVRQLSWTMRSTMLELSMMDRIYATSCWNAYSGTDPQLLADLIVECPPHLSHVASAMRAHLARFPNTVTGFGAPQEIVLKLLDRGMDDDASFVSAFIALDSNCYGWGDTQILREKHTVEEMLKGSDPAHELGGVCFRRSSSHWMWDPSKGRLLPSNNR